MCENCMYSKICFKIKEDLILNTPYKVLKVCFWKNFRFRVYIKSITDLDISILKYNIDCKTNYKCVSFFSGNYFLLPEFDIVYVELKNKKL